MLSLAVLELVGVGVIGWATFGPFSAAASFANIVTYALVAVHLILGACYWVAKVEQVRRGRDLPVGAHLLDPARRGLAFSLAIGLIVVVMSVPTQPPAAWIAAIALWLLAMAEHINYFHWQLMYDQPADVRRFLSSGFMRPHARADSLAVRDAQVGAG